MLAHSGLTRPSRLLRLVFDTNLGFGEQHFYFWMFSRKKTKKTKNDLKSGVFLQDIPTLRWFGCVVTSLWWRHLWFRSSMRKMALVPWSCLKLVPAAATFTHAKPQTTTEKLFARQNSSSRSEMESTGPPLDLLAWFYWTFSFLFFCITRHQLNIADIGCNNTTYIYIYILLLKWGTEECCRATVMLKINGNSHYANVIGKIPVVSSCAW